MFDSLKIQNVSNFYFEKRAAKNTVFHFLRGRYVVIGGPIDMNLACFQGLL